MDKETIVTIFRNFDNLFYSSQRDYTYVGGMTIELQVVQRKREYFDEDEPGNGCHLSMIIEYNGKLYDFITEASNMDNKSYWQLYEVEKIEKVTYEYVTTEDLSALTR